jgi:hypothetical protein
MDWSQRGLVESVLDKVSGAPVLIGTRMPVQTIFDNYNAGMKIRRKSPSNGKSSWPMADVISTLEYREKQYARSRIPSFQNILIKSMDCATFARPSIALIPLPFSKMRGWLRPIPAR